MNFYVMTLFPEMIEREVQSSILGRAGQNGLLSIEAVNIRDYTKDKHKKVDDYPYGGGAGMLMQAQPVYDCCLAVREKIDGKRGKGAGEKAKVVYLTPQGKTFHQGMAREFAQEEDIIFLCGHYEGIDERVLEEIVTDYVSIGDYILTGGELPALVMIDAIARLVPGVLNNETSADVETFYNGLLEYPQYSRPEQWKEKEVPGILLSGDHKKVAQWRLEQSEMRTKEWRPDLYEKYLCRKNLIEKLINKNKVLYADMWECLQVDKGEILYDGEEGAVVWNREDKLVMMAAFRKEGAEKILGYMPEHVEELQVILHQEFLLPLMEKRYRITEKLMCKRVAYNRKNPLPLPKEIEIRQLDISYAKEILGHYHLGTEEYMKERLSSGCMFGAFVEGKMAGFMGMHTEGSLGMLEVYEEYRRQGIAESLESYMINICLSKGMLPYGDIVIGNEPSFRLQRKLGMKVTKEIFYWVVAFSPLL